MPHADWLISGLEKIILPARENNVQKNFFKEIKYYNAVP